MATERGRKRSSRRGVVGNLGTAGIVRVDRCKRAASSKNPAGGQTGGRLCPQGVEGGLDQATADIERRAASRPFPKLTEGPVVRAPARSRCARRRKSRTSSSPS